MEYNPTKIRFKSNRVLLAIPIFVFGASMFGMQYYYLEHVREFKNMEIRGTVLGIGKSYGSKGSVSFYVSIRLGNGKEYAINNGLERRLLGLVSPGDSILKKPGESVVALPGKNLSVDLIDRGPGRP